MPKKQKDLSLVSLYEALKNLPLKLSHIYINYSVYRLTDVRKVTYEVEEGVAWRVWLVEDIGPDARLAELAKREFDDKCRRIPPPKGRRVWTADETHAELRGAMLGVVNRMGWEEKCSKSQGAWAELGALLKEGA